jgi:hypothetical protein
MIWKKPFSLGLNPIKKRENQLGNPFGHFIDEETPFHHPFGYAQSACLPKAG